MSVSAVGGSPTLALLSPSCCPLYTANQPSPMRSSRLNVRISAARATHREASLTSATESRFFTIACSLTA